MEDMKTPLTGALAAKMVAAMKDIDAVLKNGHNDFQKYDYVRAADVANEAREAMIAHGIAFTYDVVESEHWESTKEGKSTNYFCQLTVRVTFTDANTGEQMSGRVVGWGSDTLDKAPFKAMTGAVKYALRMNFLIPDENDPEDTALEEMRQGKQQPQTERARTFVPAMAEVDYDTQMQRSKPVGSLGSSRPDAPDEYDTHMDQRQQQRQASISPAIDPRKTKVLYAIAMGKQWDTKGYRAWINGLGFAKDGDIPAARFEEIKAKLEAA